MRSHLVSQVVLRRFCKAGELNQLDLRTGRNGLVSPDNVAYVEQDDVFKPLEKEWSYKLETPLGMLLPKLDQQKRLSEKDITTLRRCISIHLMRSQEAVELANRGVEQKLREILANLAAVYPYETEAMKEQIEAEWVKATNDEIKKLLVALSRRGSTYFQKAQFEVWVADGKENLILADVPVINMSKGGRQGVRQGVGLTDSTNIGMPLGPKIFIAATTHTPTEYKKLTPQMIEGINRRTLKNAWKAVYSQPT